MKTRLPQFTRLRSLVNTILADFPHYLQEKRGELWAQFIALPKSGFLKEQLKGQLAYFRGEGSFQNRLYVAALVINMLLVIFTSTMGPIASQSEASLLTPVPSLQSLNQAKSTKEVFGFAPFWTADNWDKVDLDTVTTVAYFGVPVLGNGELDTSDQGYITFKSQQATDFFTKAHQHGTRVVLTLTQMDNYQILALMDNPDAQKTAISEAVNEVSQRGLDGINVDMEYGGDPGQVYRDEFTQFVANLTTAMHASNPNSKVTVSVYAGSVKDPKIYDVGALAKVSDGIFMMAYDFANASSNQVIPTAPLYGAEDGTYWYDVSSAVNDFLTVMPANKLILGVPWYGYNYAVSTPGVVKAATYWGGVSQPYATAVDTDNPNNPVVADYSEGWDNLGQVGYKSYYDEASGTWRMIFLDDSKSLSMKYDFAKQKNLAGVGIWALGFDNGKPELWQTLKDAFGQKLADASVVNRPIGDTAI